MMSEAVTFTPEPIPQRDYEAIFGAYINGLRIPFADGRSVSVAEFERGYLIQLQNPANPEPMRCGAITLSREAMVAVNMFAGILTFKHSHEQLQRDQEAVEAALAEDDRARMHALFDDVPASSPNAEAELNQLFSEVTTEDERRRFASNG